MAVIDLISSTPEILAESASLDDLLETVQGIHEWEERQAEVLDHIYRYRTLRLVRSEPDEQALRSLLDHLDRVTHPRHTDTLNRFKKPYGARWLAYMELLESRLMSSASPVPRALLSRAHVQRILELIPDQGEIPLRHLQAALDIRANNLTRILDLMEANELIERKTYGREKAVRLGANGKRLLAERSVEKSGAPGARRGAFYLRAA